jgi:hypothetical protein
MANYAIKTCSECGIRKPQPEMYREEVYSETGKSKGGISGATWVGSLIFNNKKSDRAISTWLFNSGQRTYRRKKTVWLCARCSGHVFADRGPIFNKIMSAVKVIFVLGLLVIFVAALLAP